MYNEKSKNKNKRLGLPKDGQSVRSASEIVQQVVWWCLMYVCRFPSFAFFLSDSQFSVVWSCSNHPGINGKWQLNAANSLPSWSPTAASWSNFPKNLLETFKSSLYSLLKKPYAFFFIPEPGVQLTETWQNLHPRKLTCPPKKGILSIGNTSEPTIIFQGKFVSFQGCRCQPFPTLTPNFEPPKPRSKCPTTESPMEGWWLGFGVTVMDCESTTWWTMGN